MTSISHILCRIYFCYRVLWEKQMITFILYALSSSILLATLLYYLKIWFLTNNNISNVLFSKDSLVDFNILIMHSPFFYHGEAPPSSRWDSRCVLYKNTRHISTAPILNYTKLSHFKNIWLTKLLRFFYLYLYHIMYFG